MNGICLALGSNMGNPAENIKKAYYLLNSKGIEIAKFSSFYKTEPYGLKEQSDFINSVILAKTKLNLKDLFLVLKNIEKDMGREKTIKYGPRIIDIDIIYYNDLIYQDSSLTIPHPKMCERSFVLYPLAEIEPNILHPLLKKTALQLKNELKNTLKIEKLDNV